MLFWLIIIISSVQSLSHVRLLISLEIFLLLENQEHKIVKILIYVHIILPSITNTSWYSQHVSTKCINKRKKRFSSKFLLNIGLVMESEFFQTTVREAEAGMPSKVKEMRWITSGKIPSCLEIIDL